jgi:hypothetical protein
MIAQIHVHNTSFKSTEAWAVLCSLGLKECTRAELARLGGMLAIEAHIPISRLAKRLKPQLILWFNEHLPILRPLLMEGLRGQTNYHEGHSYKCLYYKDRPITVCKKTPERIESKSGWFLKMILN